MELESKSKKVGALNFGQFTGIKPGKRTFKWRA